MYLNIFLVVKFIDLVFALSPLCGFFWVEFANKIIKDLCQQQQKIIVSRPTKRGLTNLQTEPCQMIQLQSHSQVRCRTGGVPNEVQTAVTSRIAVSGRDNV